MAIELGALVVRMETQLGKAFADMSRFQKNMLTMSARFQGSMQANAAAMQRFGRQAVVTGLAVQGAFVGMTKKFGDFELAMRKATTATDITEREFAELSSFVEEQATALNIAAVEAAEGIKFLGFAGLTAQQQMQAFPPLLKLSKAGMADMGDVTEKLLAVMGAFQISFDRTGEVADKVAKIWGSSQQTLEELTTAFSFTAAGAAEMGLSIGELGSLTALMATAGIKGSRAGTTLRRTFLNLKAPTSELRDLLSDLRIKTEDANGNFRNGVDVLDDFFEATENMGATARASAFKIAFGARAVEGLTVVANKGIDSLRDFADSIEDAGGTVDIMVERRMKSLNEQLGIAGREFGNLFRLIGSKFEPEARELAATLAEVAQGFQEWIEENETLAKGLAVTAFSMGTILTLAGATTLALGSLGLAATALNITLGVMAVKMALVTGGLTVLGAAIGLVVVDVIDYRQEVRKAETSLDGLNKGLESSAEKWEKWDKALRKSAEGLKILRRETVISGRLRELSADIETVLGTSELRGLDAKIRALKPIVAKRGETFEGSIADVKRRLLEGLRQEVEQTQQILERPLENRAVEEIRKIEKAAADLVPEVENSMSQLESVFQDVGETIGDSMVNNLSDSILGVQSWSEAVLNIVNDMTRQITQAFTRMFLQQVFQNAIFGGFGASLFPVPATAAPQNFSGGGIVQPVFAANGFTARGTDTVPAMLTPGERVLTVAENKALAGMGLNGGNQPNINIHLSAIDTQSGIAFLLSNKDVIASALQGAAANNHPSRRGGR